MSFRYVLLTIGWFAAGAATTTVTLGPTSSGVSLSGTWGSNGVSFDPTASISVTFTGTAVSYVGINYQGSNSPSSGIIPLNYQATIDGVADLQFSASDATQLHDQPVTLYTKTGLANTVHTLKISHAPTTVTQPSLTLVDFIITTEDPSVSSASVVASSGSSAPSTVPSTASGGGSGSSTPGSGSTTGPGSSTAGSSTHAASTLSPGATAGTVLGAVAALAIVAWAASFAHSVFKAMHGVFPFMFREFTFRAANDIVGSHQIILTLTPVDIDKDYPCEPVVWKTFNITGESEYTARLKYQRAFGIAIVRPGSDATNNERICDEPQVMAPAQPGRALPFTGSAWDTVTRIKFILGKRNRIIARNESTNHIPLRLVMGSHIAEEGESEKQDTESESLEPARFQSFAVMDEATRIRYEEELSANSDLILRAYKTQMRDFKAGYILSKQDLEDEKLLLPLLGKEGISLEPLPEKTTWFITSKNGSEIQLTRELPRWKKFQRSLKRSK
ncbi:hypothetical protein C8F04DRAFT_1125482 [Mycena alexandri]|uniref:Uncharacterized protein n=1 Tax=Mycena alexandri TaxID=1745969 RepID=A0AAD6WV51_9AGAR|nr:hypothetical protein C8F04DRAFT_1125482 [Mycena alexandri]